MAKPLLASASCLDICLVWTPGTPVADMLVHSPPLPLIIDHVLCGDFEVSKEEGLALMLALKQCDPVRLPMAVPNLLNFVIAINEEFSNLEHLVIKSSRVRS
jgi:hypothetical protein